MSGNRTEKLLIIKPSCLGDLVQMTPAIEMLRQQRPELELSLLTEEDGWQLFSDSQQFTRVWQLERNRWSSLSTEQFTAEFLTLLHELREQSFDWVANLHHSRRSALLMQLLSPPKSIGLQTCPDGSYLPRSTEEQCFLDSFSTFSPEKTRVEQLAAIVQRKINRAQLYKELFLPLGVDPTCSCEYRLDRINDPALLESFGISTPYTVLATGNSWQSGRWPVENWLELISGLFDRRLVLLGDSKDLQRNAYICQQTLHPELLDLTGKTNVKEFAQLLSSAELVVGNDSSAAHLATAFAVPTHVLFGSSSPELCAPVGPLVTIHYQEHSCPIGPCGKMTCELKDVRCMRALSAAAVLAKEIIRPKEISSKQIFRVK